MQKPIAIAIQTGSASSSLLERVAEPDQLREEEVDPDQQDERRRPPSAPCRRGVNSGSWAARLSSAVSSTSIRGPHLTEPSSDTLRTLPVREALQALQASVDAEDERFGELLALAARRPTRAAPAARSVT